MSANPIPSLPSSLAKPRFSARKLVAVATSVMLGLGMSVVAVAGPASATHPVVVGEYACNPASGQLDITWKVSGDLRYPNETATVVTQSVETTPTFVGLSVKNTSSVTGVQSGAAIGLNSLTVAVQWTNHAKGDLVTQTGTVTIPADAACTTSDATASVSVTPATCTAPAALVYGEATFASYTGTANGATGPTSGSASTPYSVTATADAKHTFSDGSATQTFAGELAAQLSGEGCQPTPTCLPSSAVSYTYSPTTNSGVITVTDQPNSTGTLCAPFWVTATSWKFVNSSVWPQMLDQVQKLGPISEAGTYEYAATVACGQGDIYASFEAQPEPTSVLNGPSDPFAEHFLHEMGFSGPTPTYMQQSGECAKVAPSVSYTAGDCSATEGVKSLTSVSSLTFVFDNSKSTVPVTFTVAAPDLSVTPNLPTIVRTVAPGAVVTVQTSPVTTAGASFTVALSGVYGVTLPDQKVTVPSFTGCISVSPVVPASTNQTCSAEKVVGGSITVGGQTGLIYAIDGPGTANDVTGITANTTTPNLPTGAYVVSVAPDTGYVITGADAWPYTVTIAAPAKPCVELPTEPLVTPTATFAQFSCTLGGSYTLGPAAGVLWTVNGAPAAAGTTAVTTAQAVTISARPDAPKYGFEEGIPNPKVFTFTFAKPTNCPELPTEPLVTPSATFVQMTCTTGGSYTLGPAAGVLWTVNSAPAAAGTTAVAAAQVVSITARPDAPKYGFEEGIPNPKAFSFTFARPTSCPSSLPTLALTGSGSGSTGTALVGLALMVIGGLLVTVRIITFRRRTAQS